MLHCPSTELAIRYSIANAGSPSISVEGERIRCGNGEPIDGDTRLTLVSDCPGWRVLGLAVDGLVSFSGWFQAVSGASVEALRARAELEADLRGLSPAD